MPRRPGNTTRPDIRLEATAAEQHRKMAEHLRAAADDMTERNRTIYLLYHAHGYTQKAIAEILNQDLGPNDPHRVTDAAIEKVVLRMAS
jgi:DNA-directed RNA polymerase specialized sigma24 family protein